MVPVECINENAADCPRTEDCATLIVWQKLNDAIGEVIDGITLADLKSWQLGINGENSA